MVKKKDSGRPADLDMKIRKELDDAFDEAETYFATHKEDIPPTVAERLEPKFICLS